MKVEIEWKRYRSGQRFFWSVSSSAGITVFDTWKDAQEYLTNLVPFLEAAEITPK